MLLEASKINTVQKYLTMEKISGFSNTFIVGVNYLSLDYLLATNKKVDNGYIDMIWTCTSNKYKLETEIITVNLCFFKKYL